MTTDHPAPEERLTEYIERMLTERYAHLETLTLMYPEHDDIPKEMATIEAILHGYNVKLERKGDES